MALKRLLALLTASSCHCLETCCQAFQNDTELREAVRRWQQEVEGPGLISKYGDIADWDVGMVTNMSRLFADTSFNEPIGSWNTSAVTNMHVACS
jgi:surface protein